MKCFYCGQPVDLLSLHVDHVLPKSLANDPTRLEATLRDYEVIENYPDFSLDALSNMVPSHGASCNLRKGDAVYPKQTTLFYLSITHKSLPQILAELHRLRTTATRGDVLGKLEMLIEKGAISDSEVADVVAEWRFRSTLDEPAVVTFGLNFPNTLKMRGLETTGSSGYATTCDRLEAELVEAIRSVTDQPFHYPEVSARDGETLSVRLVFPTASLREVDTLHLDSIPAAMPWWTLLELTNFHQVYGHKYHEAIDPRQRQDDSI